MKKFLLTIIFALVTNVCFAENVFIATENGYSRYLNPDTFIAKVIPKNNQDSVFQMTYTVVAVPSASTLANLRTQTFDNRIAYEKQTLTFVCSFNKQTKQWNTDGSLWMSSHEIWGDKPEKSLYEFHGYMPGGAYYGDTPEATANRNVVIAAYKYAIDHNLIQYED